MIVHITYRYIVNYVFVSHLFITGCMNKITFLKRESIFLSLYEYTNSLAILEHKLKTSENSNAMLRHFGWLKHCDISFLFIPELVDVQLGFDFSVFH